MENQQQQAQVLPAHQSSAAVVDLLRSELAAWTYAVPLGVANDGYPTEVLVWQGPGVAQAQQGILLTPRFRPLGLWLGIFNYPQHLLLRNTPPIP